LIEYCILDPLRGQDRAVNRLGDHPLWLFFHAS
jgi:hypothetical protein